MDLSQYKVAITGASSGIGKALLQEFAQSGAHCLAIDINTNGLDELKKISKTKNWSLECFASDITKLQSLEPVFKSFETTVPHNKGLQDYVWIHAAGIQSIGSYEEIGRDNFWKIFDVNFRAQVEVTEKILEFYKKISKGNLIHISSMAGFLASPYMSSYVASKHAIVGYTRSLQLELDFEHWPIHVMLACPGFVKTPMIHGNHLKDAFPSWLSWILSSPQAIASEIIKDFTQKRRESYPGWNGKMMRAAHYVAPWTASKSSKLLMTKNFKDALLGKYHR